MPYLAELGITDCYLSPILQPCAPNSHGYDVADHGQLNEAIGGEAGYEALAEALRAQGMGQLVDVVPNHMGISGRRNVWWQDVRPMTPPSIASLARSSIAPSRHDLPRGVSAA